MSLGPKRRLLLVYPRFANNHFLNFEHMAPFYPGKRAVMPSLGLLTFAAVAGGAWTVRLVDENVRPVSSEDVRWADVVALSGMHPQRQRINGLLELAAHLGKITVLGGPSVSICPEYYPQADVLHVGEIGDGTAEMLRYLAGTTARPRTQRVFHTTVKTPLEELPLPALDCIDVNAYLVMPIQFSVGCPYTCEFCDIPAIYGRMPRVKSPARVVAELQGIFDRGFVGTILFVDDNLIAQRKALLNMLPEVIAWQQRNRYPYPLTGEASVNIARDGRALDGLRAARFTHLFLGVESPDAGTLSAISKKQNIVDPLLDSIHRIQSFGIEVIMGMIFGFDTDTEDSGRRMARFVDDARAPIVYFNLLAALPKTPLWARLEREGRLIADVAGDACRSDALLTCLTTNVAYRLPNAVVEEMLRTTVREVYAAAAVYRRFRWNVRHVYARQIAGVPPARTAAERFFLLRFTAGTLARVLWRAGVRSHDRVAFWRFVLLLAALRVRGAIGSVLEILLRVAPNAHHLIEWGKRLDAPAPRAAHAAMPRVRSRMSSGIGRFASFAAHSSHRPAVSRCIRERPLEFRDSVRTRVHEQQES